MYYMIGNTHFDPVWEWKWDEAMASIRATFRSALDRMNEDENFVYSFATPPVFEWIRKIDPEMFEEIRQRALEGRWEMAEGWWLQPDCYSASGESYVRQGLYGQRYTKKYFGKYSDAVFNIDSFGHSPMLPQILSKSHIDYYCFVRPEKHHIELKKPLFVWKSPDGSSVLTYRADNAYDKNLEERLTQNSEDELIVFGVTDHGGAPTKKDIATINACEFAKFSSVSGFFKDHADCDYIYTDELITGDFGPYANYSKIKKLNRIGEYAILNAEKASLIAGDYDQETLTKCWEDILFNQFHDIIGGACIKDAYFDAENMQGRAIISANEIMHINLQKVTRKVKTPGKNPDNAWNIVLWNLNAVPYNGYVEAEVQWLHEFDAYQKGLVLEDENGKKYPCQVIREKSVIPGFRSRFIFNADVPAMGYKALKLIQTGEDVEKTDIDIYEIKTDKLCISFSKETGCIEKISDRETGINICNKTFVPVVYGDDGDTWCFNVTTYESKPSYCKFVGAEVIESGNLFTEIKMTYSYKSSKIEMYYRFYTGKSYFDVRYRVNWEEKHTVLKFECDAGANEHISAVPAGFIKREETEPDVPAGLWIKTENMAVTSDSIFAYNMKNNILGLTILRSAIYGDFRMGDIDYSVDYDIIDRGITEGSIRMFFEGDLWNEAESFNNKPVVICEANHDGTLAPEHSFADLSDGAVLMALKKCEDDDSIVVRIAESEGTGTTATLNVFGNSYKLTLAPYEIKTIKLAKDGTYKEIYMTEEE